MSWSTLNNTEDLTDFFARLYEQSRSRRMKPAFEDVIDPHGCICSLPGAEEFPLWRIQCRVFIIHMIEENFPREG